PTRRVEVHNPFDVVDRVVILEAPDRAHVATQIAARGIIDEKPVRHLRDWLWLPVVFRVGPFSLGPVAHRLSPFKRLKSLMISDSWCPAPRSPFLIPASVGMTSGFGVNVGGFASRPISERKVNFDRRKLSEIARPALDWPRRGSAARARGRSLHHAIAR